MAGFNEGIVLVFRHERCGPTLGHDFNLGVVQVHSFNKIKQVSPRFAGGDCHATS